MQSRGRRTSRTELIRLHQAIEGFKGWEGRGSEHAPNPGMRATTEHSTQWFLDTMDGNRRLYTRVSEKCPYKYSENIGRKWPPGGTPSGEDAGLDYVQWLYDISIARNLSPHVSSRTKMIVHLQSIKGELVYFIAFIEGKPEDKVFLPARELVLSGSGMSFPTEMRHAQGEDLFVVFFLPTTPFPPVKFKGMVVRNSKPAPPDEGFITPMKLTSISPEDHERLTKYIHSEKTHRLITRTYYRGVLP